MKRREAGQGMAEYALILVLIAVLVIALLLLLGPIIHGTFCTIIAGLGDVQHVPITDGCTARLRFEGVHWRMQHEQTRLGQGSRC